MHKITKNIKIIIVSYIENQGLLISFTNIPFGFFVCTRLMIYFTESYSLDANSFNDCVIIYFIFIFLYKHIILFIVKISKLIIALRLYFLIQNVILSIKLDGWVNWSWKEIFWCYWVYFSVSLGMIISLLIMIFNRCFTSLFEENNSFLESCSFFSL